MALVFQSVKSFTVLFAFFQYLVLVCDDLPDPANGLVSYSPSDIPFLDTVATYNCTEGYEVSSPSTQTCVDGPANTVEWSPSAAPTCTSKCAHPMDLCCSVRNVIENVCMCVH